MRRLLFCVALALPSLRTAVAQAPAGDPQPPPLSKDCQTPGVTISGAVPLPNVQRVLKERKTIRIMTIGASSSALMQSTGESYFKVIEGVLEKTIPGLDIQIVDRGISGELASDAGDRMKTEVALANPDLVLWQLGSSDALAQVSVEQFETAVEQAVIWLKAHGVDVALVGVQYVRSLTKDPHYQAIRAATSRVAERQQVLRIGRYEAMQVIEQGRNMSAEERPNEFAITEQGYACLSEYIVRAITSGIFVRPVKGR